MGSNQHFAPHWPSAASEVYEAIRPLGHGGFGSVWLASKKGESSDDKDGADAQVAIKLIGSGNKTSTKVEEAYARREVSILSELSHPRIVRLVASFGENDNAGKLSPSVLPEKSAPSAAAAAPTCIALSYARGPTLEQLLAHGGALGVHAARTVTAQLVDAVSYLHGRAVIHRDIKPDNCIVTGALPSDDAVYSDGTDGEDAAREGRWKLTLIDFGFARALRPEDVSADIALYKMVHKQDEPQDMDEKNANPKMLPSLDAPLEEGGSSKRGRGEDMDKSVSKKTVRNLSALGNRSYAAPEITKGMRKNSFLDLSSSLRGRGRGRGGDRDGSKHSGSNSGRRVQEGPLAECVSDYVDDFMAMRNNPVAVTARAVGKVARKVTGKKKKKKDDNKRKKRYKGNDKVPKEAAQLVRALTHWDHRKRTTVRAARLYSWINPTPYVDDQNVDKADTSHSMPGGEVDFLQCALNEPVIQAKSTQKKTAA